MIFVWSVQHTGTWTTIDWLLQHRDMQGFVQLRNLRDLLVAGIGGKRHQLAPEGQRSVVESWAGQATVVHNHMTKWGETNFPGNVLLAFGMLNPTACPLRDPLAACLSSQARMEKNGGKGRPATAALEQWRYLAEVYQVLGITGNLAFIPWDLPKTVDDRLAMLEKARLTLGLLDKKTTAKFAREWPITNSIGGYELKRLYRHRKAEEIEKTLPKFWRELRELEPLLRPWLEEIGYKDLMWWSK